MAAFKWLAFSITLAVATLSASTAVTVYIWRKKKSSSDDADENKVKDLEISLRAALDKCAAERQGRIRAQQALRKAIARQTSENLELSSFPLAPIGTVKSCFSTRNGTPRQPLVVPLAKAWLVFDLSRVPPASLEGLEGYSHCWIIYIFHLNTDLEKLWKNPSQSKFKAKVRVPRLKGGRMGVFATRSPHRPCPIGLTLAKVETVEGNKISLSGVDLVDGTPVLDVKPYLPYCDSIPGATIPQWVKEDTLLAIPSVNFSEDFCTSMATCWEKVEKNSLYASSDEFQSLVKQVLSWDIRSVSQRSRPHNAVVKTDNHTTADGSDELNSYQDDAALENGSEQVSLCNSDVVYHLILEGLDVSYKFDSNGNINVEKVTLSSHNQVANRVQQ